MRFPRQRMLSYFPSFAHYSRNDSAASWYGVAVATVQLINAGKFKSAQNAERLHR